MAISLAFLVHHNQVLIKRILMIVGFMKRNRGRADWMVEFATPVGTDMYSWGVAAAPRATDSIRLAQDSLWGHDRIFKTKKLQSKADEAKWENAVNGSKRGSYPMKWFLVVLMAMLPAIPGVAMAQQAQSPAAATADSTAPATQKPSTTDSSDIAHYIIGS
jgi:hypothetical protein